METNFPIKLLTLSKMFWQLYYIWPCREGFYVLAVKCGAAEIIYFYIGFKVLIFGLAPCLLEVYHVGPCRIARERREARPCDDHC